MFTGIVEALGIVRRVEPLQSGVRALIGSGNLILSDVRVGDSICVDGCCLTVTALDPAGFYVDLSRETLDRTIGLAVGAPVNLEKALRLSDRLGGHLVTGHVDGCGEIARVEPVGESRLLEVRVPVELTRYLARKGSITVNGVSLTVNGVDEDRFNVNLIPHTLAVTNLGHVHAGARVNLEADLIARYLERLLGDSGQ
jgi:riboflavin synthase